MQPLVTDRVFPWLEELRVTLYVLLVEFQCPLLNLSEGSQFFVGWATTLPEEPIVALRIRAGHIFNLQQVSLYPKK